MLPPKMPLRYIDYFEALEEEQIRGEASLNFPYLLKDRKSQRHINVIKSPPQEFHQPGRIDSSQEKRVKVDTTPRQISSQTIVLPICLKKPFIFPKNHLLSPERPTFSFPFPY